MKCLNCGEEFSPMTVTQKYCCQKCGNQYRHKHKGRMDELYPSIVFTCSCCGRTVETEGGTSDRRTRFCSRSCEKKFWRHRDKVEHEGMSGRTNFHSFGEYASYERRSNQ